MTEECYTCRSLSGEQRISPGPPIHEGDYWIVEHAYPCGMVGWLVLVLKRHVEALHELTPAEFIEMGELLALSTRILRDATGCVKEYALCLAEAPHFKHIHVHVIARRADIPDELRGARIFAMLKVSAEEAIPPAEVAAFCVDLRARFAALNIA